MRAFEHGARAEEARAREIGGADARLRGPAGMQSLGPRALGEILDDAARERADDAERVHPLRVRQPQRRRHAGRSAHGAEHRGRMEARVVDALRRDQASAAHELDADGDAGERVAPLETLAFRHRQDRRHDHRTGVHRSAFEGVVEVFAVRRGAIHERGAGAVERARLADGRAPAIALPAGERRAHVIRAPRRDA